jgi:hypothetical protein
MKYFLAIILAFSLVSCDDGDFDSRIKYSKLESVWFHESERYSITVLENGILNNIAVPSHRRNDGTVVYVDGSDPAWAEVTYSKEGGGSVYASRIEIHVKDASTITGGGWNHGKFGSGSTQKID